MLVRLLLLLSVAGYSQASCFGRDAGFTPNNAKPVVTQPSRNDPSKVMVDWSKIVKNPQCVDSFTVLVWADGTQQTTATKYQVDKKTMSKMVDIQPCVNYKFAVESHEKNTMGMKTKTSGDQVFKTVGASSSSVRLTANSFQVSYLWDPVKKVVDLKTATITIPRDKVPGASCLDYIQITGEQVRSRSRSGSVSPARSRSFSWNHLGQSPMITTGGGASTLPASLSYSNVASGTRSRSGSTSSTSSRGSIRSGSTTPVAAPISAPNYGNTLPRPSGGATARVGPIKVAPPFLNPLIEMKVPVKDCAEYNFEIKLFSGRKEVAKVTGVKLPTLADVPGYIPPPITSVMSISYGTSGKPVYGVKTASGVNSACLPAYFEAYDAYTHRLENEVGWMNKEGNRVQGIIAGSQSQLERSQEELLRKAGCTCSSPHLRFLTDPVKDRDIASGKYGGWFGHYHFQGMHANRPYFMLMPATHGASHASTGATARPSATTARPTTTVAPPTTPIYLYWEERNKQWLFGPNLGATSKVEFGSLPNSAAIKCPGDTNAAGKWQYKSSVLSRWKKNAHMKVECDTRH